MAFNNIGHMHADDSCLCYVHAQHNFHFQLQLQAMEVDEQAEEGQPPRGKKDLPVVQPSFPVATWKALGLNLRAFFNGEGQPQWIYERVHKHWCSKVEGGTFLRKNLTTLHSFMMECSVPEAELGYKGKHHTSTTSEPWHDHTVSSRALLCMAVFHFSHKRTEVQAKVAALTLLCTLVLALSPGFQSAGPVSVSFADDDGTLHRQDLKFTPQAVTTDWANILNKNSEASALWRELGEKPWCKHMVASSANTATLQDIMFFLCFLVGHSKGTFCNLYQSVCKLVLPDILLWLASLMDAEAGKLSHEPLEELPMLRTATGTFKRKADHVNRFILLDRMKKLKSGRKKVASTHQALVPEHSDLVQREAHIQVAIYMENVTKAFSDPGLPKQFAVSFDPSDYGGKSTLVSTIYSVANDCAAFLPNQRVSKITFGDLHDSFIEEAKASKLGTLEGYSEVRALSYALMKATGCSLMDFRVSKSVIARPLQDGESRLCVNGAWYICGPGDMVRHEVPPDINLSQLPALVTVSDQGPSNTASLNFLMYGGEHLMVHCLYDSFHRGWNDVKLSAKRSVGYPWKCILQLVLLFNINYSPFGSAAFFYKKQSVLEAFLATRTHKDPAFQDAIPNICRERKITEPASDEEEKELFMSLAHISNFQKKGGLIKLLRWMSFFEIAMEWQGDMWATKLILESSQDKKDSAKDTLDLQKLESQIASTGSDKKADAKKELNDLKKTAGVWRLAPKMVTDKNITTLNMLLLVCKASWKRHAERARSVCNPSQVLNHHLECSMAMGWAAELEEMVASALWKKHDLRHMYPKDQDNDLLLEQHCSFFHNMMNTRATSLAASYTLPPMRWNGVLLPDQAEARIARDKLLTEWNLLLKLEAASLHSARVTCLEKLFWRLGTFTRILAMAHQRDKEKGLDCQNGEAFQLHMLLCKHLGDSRVVEVAHQQGPDLQRMSRQNSMSDSTIMYGTINSGALTQRKLTCVEVDPQDIIYSSNKRQTPIKKSLTPSSHHLDPGLQRMMRRRQGKNHWPSPSPASLFPSLSATEWVFSWMQGQHPGQSIDDAWLSCLAGNCGELVAHKSTSTLWKVVGSAEFGFLAWSMDVASNSIVFMRPNRHLLQWQFITCLDDWLHIPTKPFLSDGGTIQWKITGPALPLQIAFVQGKATLTVAQMKRLLHQMQVPFSSNLGKAGLHQCLVEAFLSKDDDQKKAMDAFTAANAAPDEAMDSDMEDLVSCLDAEDANELDLKELKDKKRKKRYQRKATDDSQKQVPDRSAASRGKGRGKGRGRARGTGRGRGRGNGKGRGKGKVFKNMVKSKRKPGACQDVPLEVPGAGQDVAQPAPLELPEAGEQGVAPAAPPEVPEAGGQDVAQPAPLELPEGGEQVPEPGGQDVAQPAPLELPEGGEQAPETGGQDVAQPAPLELPEGGEQAPETGGQDVAQPAPLDPQAGEQGVAPAAPQQPDLPDQSCSSTVEAAPAEPPNPAEPASSSSAQPEGQEPPKPNRKELPLPHISRIKVYSTPLDVLLEMMPPDCCRIVLNHNEHRFSTTWTGNTKGVPADLGTKHFSRSFVNKPWKQALSEVHHRAWEKWSFVAKHHPLPKGIHAQEPGKVPEDVLKNLEPFIKKLPPVKNYKS